MSSPDTQRYATVAIVLHWTIAVLLIGLICAGLWMTSGEGAPAPGSTRFAVYQMHKSFGITVLVLTIARIAWRLMNPAPALPANMAAWERLLARAVHGLFYLLMIALPLTGWAIVSTSRSGLPTILFNVVDWPHLPLPASRDLHEVFEEAHELLAFGAIGLIVLHVAGAVKHLVVERENLFTRMAPGGPREPGRGLLATIAAPVVFVAVVLAAGAAASERPAPAPADVAATEPAPENVAEDLIENGAEDAAAETVETAMAEPAPAVAPAAEPEAAETSEPAPTVEPEAAETPEPAAPIRWAVDTSTSAIRFSGVQSGQPFEGAFSDWSAEIVFDPARPEAAHVEVTINTASAATGDSFIDGALGSSSWLDARNHPEARFVSDGFRFARPGAYETTGQLTLKGESRSVDLPFTLALDGDAARAEGQTTINRRDFAVGTDDPDNDGAVEPEIVIDVVVEAARAG